MSLQFITGASGAGKSTYIYRQIIARSEKEPEGRFFILVPDQFTMQTQKDLVSLHDRKGIMNIDVLSFGRLTHRIFEEMGGNRLPMLDDTGKSLIIRRSKILSAVLWPRITRIYGLFRPNCWSSAIRA